VRQFIAAHPDAFAAQRYEPFTHVRKSDPTTGFGGFHFEVRSAAPPLRGLRGVFATTPVPASSVEQRLLLYPGVLMTGDLYEVFCAQYHCPTGLELQALNYIDDETRKAVTMLIVGDPTSLGALINDGVEGRKGE
jgi:hypothetical protein